VCSSLYEKPCGLLTDYSITASLVPRLVPLGKDSEHLRRANRHNDLGQHEQPERDLSRRNCQFNRRYVRTKNSLRTTRIILGQLKGTCTLMGFERRRQKGGLQWPGHSTHPHTPSSKGASCKLLTVHPNTSFVLLSCRVRLRCLGLQNPNSRGVPDGGVTPSCGDVLLSALRPSHELIKYNMCCVTVYM